MTREFGSGLFVIPNLFRDLGFGFRIWVLKPRPVGGVLYLMKKYGEKPEWLADYIIAATAWSKRLPFLTRNRKHFAHIEEITLSPGYEVERNQIRK